MIWREYKNTIIVSAIAGIVLILLLIFLFVDVSLGPIKVASLSNILSQHEKVTKFENDMLAKNTMYKNDLNKLENAKEEYKAEKSKYDSISDETVKIIKDATTQEEYSIEYMWIRLGNHAKASNVSIVLVEPGGSQNENVDKATSQISDNTTTTTQPVQTQTNTKDNSSSNEEVIQNDKKEELNNSNNNEFNSMLNSLLNNNLNSDKTFKVEVTGSYMNVSDFIFVVENDNELRFKLDNILMECVSGTTIKTTFDVKNMVIKK